MEFTIDDRLHKFPDNVFRLFLVYFSEYVGDPAAPQIFQTPAQLRLENDNDRHQSDGHQSG